MALERKLPSDSGYRTRVGQPTSIMGRRLHVPPSSFARGLMLLRDGGYRVLSRMKRSSDCTTARPPRPAVMLRSTTARTTSRLDSALSLLQEFRLPGDGLPDELSRSSQPAGIQSRAALYFGRRGTGRFRPTGLRRTGTSSPGSGRSRTQHCGSAPLYRARLVWTEKDDVVAMAAARLGFDYGELLRTRLLHLMSPDEVSRLPRRPDRCAAPHASPPRPARRRGFRT